MPEENIVNYAVLGEVAALLRKKFPTIVEAYIEEAQNYVAGIFEGIEKGDARTIAQNAHPLKSSSEGMGVIRVHVLAKAMEFEAKSAAESGASVAPMKQSAEDVKAALAQAVPLLQEYMKQHVA